MYFGIMDTFKQVWRSNVLVLPKNKRVQNLVKPVETSESLTSTPKLKLVFSLQIMTLIQ